MCFGFFSSHWLLFPLEISLLVPADSGMMNRVNLWGIGLDIYQGRAIKGVHTANLEEGPFALQKFDYAEAYGIGAVR